MKRKACFLLLEHWLDPKTERIVLIAVKERQEDLPQLKDEPGKRYSIWKRWLKIITSGYWKGEREEPPGVGLEFYPDDGPGRWIALRKLLKGAKPCK